LRDYWKKRGVTKKEGKKKREKKKKKERCVPWQCTAIAVQQYN